MVVSSLVLRGWGEGTGRGLDVEAMISEASVLVGDERRVQRLDDLRWVSFRRLFIPTKRKRATSD